jgi:ferredoxin-NADP reductase
MEKQIEFETEVIDVIKRTNYIKSFRFRTPEEIYFNAGQIFNLTIKLEGQDSTKHFSFSNSPTEKGCIEFTKRITGSKFSLGLDRLVKGDWGRINMPFGSFAYKGEDEKIAFITGGIGITCVRSICKFVSDMKLSTDIVLLYSAKTVKDIVFYEDFDKMSSLNNKLRIVYTLTSPDVDRLSWNGRLGRINSEMVSREIPDLSERIFYLTGPPKMVDSLNSILSDELNIENEKIRLERFLGYT